MLLIVDSESEGQRLDNFLVKKILNIPKSRIYRMVRKGEVRINSGRAKPCRKLILGDKVRVPSLAGLEIKVKQALEYSTSGLNKKINEISNTFIKSLLKFALSSNTLIIPVSFA